HPGSGLRQPFYVQRLIDDELILKLDDDLGAPICRRIERNGLPLYARVFDQVPERALLWSGHDIARVGNYREEVHGHGNGVFQRLPLDVAGDAEHELVDSEFSRRIHGEGAYGPGGSVKPWTSDAEIPTRRGG